VNPIPAEDTERAVVDAGKTAGDAAKRERLVAEVEEMVVLHFAGTGELLPEDAIVEGSWICESYGFRV